MLPPMPVLPTPEEWESRKAVWAAKEADIKTNLPSWTQVETACNNISNLAEAKDVIRKLSRVVYWLSKNKEE